MFLWFSRLLAVGYGLQAMVFAGHQEDRKHNCQPSGTKSNSTQRHTHIHIKHYLRKLTFQLIATNLTYINIYA